MRITTLMGLATIALASSAYAAPASSCPANDPSCTPPTVPVCFNLVCYYHADEHRSLLSTTTDPHQNEQFHECKVASTFIKNVSVDGGEVDDVSATGNTVTNTNPTLEVSCDDNPVPVYNNSSYRATDLLGTLIQAQAGPTPSIRLPRGELHTGSDNNLSGAHVSPSQLLISPSEAAADDVQRMEGQCYIWTGNP